MDISVIIINYHTRDLTIACIDSVIRFTEGLSYEIVLVENASGEFTKDDEQRWDGRVKIVVSEKNLGFAGGNNLGIAQATGKYFLLLNSDTYLKDNALLATYTYMEQTPAAGVVSARLIFPDGRHQSAAQRFPSVKYKLIELLRIQKFMSRKAAGKLLLGAFFDHAETVKADWVWGTYFMFRRDILDKLKNNKLDDTYFMYNEDIQWCIDIKKLGYEIHFFAGAEIVHIMGGSSGKKNQMMNENAALFMKKNYSFLSRLLLKIL